MNEERKPDETIPKDEEKQAEVVEETVEPAELTAMTAPDDPIAIVSADLDDFLDLIEKRNKAIVRLTQLAIEKTTRHCWNDMGDYPYMNIAGAERMARVFMVRIEDMRCVKGWSEDEGGRYYIFTYSARFSLPGIMDSTLEIGTCSQRDQFFGKRHIKKLDDDGKEILDKWNKPELEEVLLPMKDIDEGTIRKSAWTNCKIRGTRSLLGMQGITWEELEKVAGIRRADVKGVQFSKNKPGGGSYPATDKQKGLVKYRASQAKCPVEKVLERLGVKVIDELMGNQVNPALDFIKGWGNTDDIVRSAEGKVSNTQAQDIRMMMAESGMTEETFKKMFGNLPEDINPKQVEVAKRVLNQKIDERNNK